MIYEFALGRPCAAPFDHQQIYDGVHRLRHFLYRERLDWDIPEFNGLEYDQFDTPAASYLVAVDDAGAVRAQSRLITCDHDYMLATLWPQLAQRRPLPVTANHAEGSRTGVDLRMTPGERDYWWGRLLIAHVEWALIYGVETITFVTYPGMVTGSLIPHGLDVQLYGEPMPFSQGDFVAGWFDCSAEHAAWLRAVHDVPMDEQVFEPLPIADGRSADHVA